MELTASVIICTRNRHQDIVRCLTSIAQQTLMPHELIVVDSSDKPLIHDQRFTELFNVHTFTYTALCYVHTKPGLTAQRNEGIQKAKHDIIYFFDDDVLLSSTYLATMQKVFQANSAYAGGMGTISNTCANVSWRYQWFRRFFLLPRQQGSGMFTFSGMPTHPYGSTEFKEVQVVGGCCMAFRRTILEQFLFDETLQGYCYLEDADVAYRISRHYPLFFNPNAHLEHHESPIARDRWVDVSTMVVYNYSYIFFKNFYPSHRVKIIGYWWSLCGLFLQSIYTRDWQQLKGFWRGLMKFYRKGV